jgi:hypothetical protein
MKTRKRTDKWSFFKNFIVVQKRGGQEYDLTWFVYGCIVLIITYLVGF